MGIIVGNSAGGTVPARTEKEKNIAGKIGNAGTIRSLVSNDSPKKFRRKYILLTLAVLAGVIGLANIQLPKENDDNPGNKSGIDIMVALDVSKSMLSSDIKPTRLDRAKQVISKLIDQLGDNRLGIVVFAGQAITQMPLTDDIGAANMYVSTIDPGMIPIQGTVIGDALLACDRAFRTGEKKYKAVILISDGEDHDPQTDAALTRLKNDGVIVHTIGVGTPDGAQIIDPETNTPKLDAAGKVVISKLNEKELKKIAAETGGQYALLNNEVDAPKNIISAINNTDKKLIRTGKMPGEKNFTYFFPVLILAMILLLVTELFISERKRSLA